MAHDLSHDADATRYTLRVDGHLVSSLDYEVSGGHILFTHTFTDPSARGHGYAAELVAFAVDDVESSTQLRVVPRCWYVGEWFDRHPDRATLLAR